MTQIFSRQIKVSVKNCKVISCYEIFYGGKL